MAWRRQYTRQYVQSRNDQRAKANGLTRYPRSIIAFTVLLLSGTLYRLFGSETPRDFSRTRPVPQVGGRNQTITNLYEYSLPDAVDTAFINTPGTCNYLAEDLHGRSFDTLASMLNAGSFAGLTPPNGTEAMIQAGRSFALKNPVSVMAFYLKESSTCFRLPHLPNLQKALELYKEKSASIKDDDVELVSQNSTLVVYVSGEPSFSDECVKLIASEVQSRGEKFSHVVVFGKGQSKASWRSEIKSFTGTRVNILSWESKSEDDQLYLMSKASYMISSGGLGAIGTLLGNSMVYFSKSSLPFQGIFQYDLYLPWQNRIFLRDPLKSRWYYQPSYDKLGRLHTTCGGLREFGKEGHRKSICISEKLQEPSCWIVSLESRGDWSFELDAVANTECHIIVLDCAASFPPPQSIADRVMVQDLCMQASPKREKEKHYLWPELLQKAIRNARDAGIVLTGAPDVLKLDMDGLEWEWMDYLSDLSDTSILPTQLALEIHLITYMPIGAPFSKFPRANHASGISAPGEPLTDFGLKLKKLGYYMVARRDWSSCDVCAEFLFIRD